MVCLDFVQSMVCISEAGALLPTPQPPRKTLPVPDARGLSASFLQKPLR